MIEKHKEVYKLIILDIKRVFSEVNNLPKQNTPENKLIMVEKSEELLSLYREKWKYKRQRYDERLFCKTLAYILKNKDNPTLIQKLERAYKKR